MSNSNHLSIVATESGGSDMELPEQVVSDAIKRINLDSDDGTRRNSSSDEAVYSNSLLQQFVEKTQLLSTEAGQNVSEINTEPRKRKRGRPPKIPEEENYLHCSVSNVSPDSGIQSVAGSPIHRSCSPPASAVSQNNQTSHKFRSSPTPPLNPIKRGPGRPPTSIKRGPGRPKTSGKFHSSNSSSKSQNAPSINASPLKRGPGRPKKLKKKDLNNSKNESKKPHLSLSKARTNATIINEICERVSKKLDLSTCKKILNKAKEHQMFRIRSHAAINAATSKVKASKIPVRKHIKKKKKKRLQSNSWNREDPGFAHELENLITEFNRCSLVSRNKDTATPSSPDSFYNSSNVVNAGSSVSSCTVISTQSSNNTSSGITSKLPSIFRVKRIGKKRKGSEKSRNSDKESGNEDKEKERERDKEKIRQRRPKKSGVEAPKVIIIFYFIITC